MCQEKIEYKIHSKYSVFYLHEVSDDLKNYIRKFLSAICYGSKKALERNRKYRSTLSSFHERFNKKSDDQKKGLIAELLTHILTRVYFTKFDIASPFFNMEEQSMRKGFDLLLVDKETNTLWYSEVKSGELPEEASSSPNSKIIDLLVNAKKDIAQKITSNRNSLWDNAINSVDLAVENNKDYKDAVINILNTNYENIIERDTSPQLIDSNVILSSVLFHRMGEENEKFKIETIEKFSRTTISENLFNSTLIIAIQQKAYSEIEDFLFNQELS